MTPAEDPSKDVKALAMKRIETMRVSISPRQDNLRLVWRVRDCIGVDTVDVRESTIHEVVEKVHKPWVALQGRRRSDVVARAQKFGVSEVADMRPEFLGVSEVTGTEVNVLAHLYDLIVEDRLGVEPDREHSKPIWRMRRVSQPNVVIKAPTLCKLSAKYDAFLHQEYLDEQKATIKEAYALGMISEPHDEDEGASLEEVEEEAEEAEEDHTGRPPSRHLGTRGWVVVCAASGIAGLLIGYLAGVVS